LPYLLRIACFASSAKELVWCIALNTNIKCLFAILARPIVLSIACKSKRLGLHGIIILSDISDAICESLCECGGVSINISVMLFSHATFITLFNLAAMLCARYFRPLKKELRQAY